MIKKTLLLLALALSTACSSATDVDSLKKKLEKELKSSGEDGAALTLESVKSTPIPGLFEVVTSDHKILYADETGHYLLTGHLIDIQKLQDITSDRLEELTAISFKDLPLELAIKEVRGNGARQVVVFSDTDCPYCRRLENNIQSIDNITIYTFLYPIAALHPNAYEHSKRIWCAQNRLKAWRSYWADNAVPEAPSCDVSALEKIQALGRQHHIDATPTLIFENGKVVPGALSSSEFEKLLNQR